MTAKAKLSETFEIAVPEEVRAAQNWHAGQEFVFVPDGRTVRLVPVPTINDLRGIARGADPTGYRDRDDRY